MMIILRIRSAMSKDFKQGKLVEVVRDRYINWQVNIENIYPYIKYSLHLFGMQSWTFGYTYFSKFKSGCAYLYTLK